MDRALPTESPSETDGGRLLPRNLGEAIEAFESSTLYRKSLGDPVVDYLTAIHCACSKRVGP